MEKADVFFVRAVTPVHIGVDAGLGAVNLPTMRESVTKHPVIPGSSFKGVLRDMLGLHADSDLSDRDPSVRARWAAFGPTRNNASDYRGGLVLSDARVLFLPVASLKGTFAWITSRAVLHRHHRELRELGLTASTFTPPDDDASVVAVAPESRLLFPKEKKVALREMLISASEHASVEAFARETAAHLGWRDADATYFAARVAIVPDDLFDAFARTSLEVRTRVAINADTGTAEASGPWSEEHVPTDAIFAGVVLGRPTRYGAPTRKGAADHPFTGDEMLNVFRDAIGSAGVTLRIGGHASVGLGRVRVTRREGAK